MALIVNGLFIFKRLGEYLRSMKKSCYIYLLILTSLISKAQLEKQKIMLDINGSYSQNSSGSAIDPNLTSNNYKSTDEYKYSNFITVLNYGYFVSNKIAMGITGAYQTYVFKDEDASGFTSLVNKSSYKLYNAGGFTRFYKAMKENKIAVYGNIRAFYLWGDFSTEQYTTYNGIIDPHQKEHGLVSGYGASFNPGFVYFVTKKIGLEISFGNITYIHQKNETYAAGFKNGSSISDGLNTNFSYSSLFLGITFHMGGKPEL